MRILGCLRHVNLNLLYEIRMRTDKPLAINLAGKFCFLGERGVCDADGAMRPTKEEVENALLAACGYSVYAAETQLRQGFVTAACGERLGIAGSVVYEQGSVHAIREITSLCIRIPHEVVGCAQEIFTRCFVNGVCSLLILAPPGEGKTTILRDLTRIVSEKTRANILVSDERGELSAGYLGETVDVVRYADKQTAFTSGIRAMRPEIIVTDELLPADYVAVRRAVESGIVVFASAHLTRYEDVPENLFSRYVTLTGLGEIGCIRGKEGEDVG